MFERITNMEEEFAISVLHNRKGNLGYGDYSKVLGQLPSRKIAAQPLN